MKIELSKTLKDIVGLFYMSFVIHGSALLSVYCFGGNHGESSIVMAIVWLYLKIKDLDGKCNSVLGFTEAVGEMVRKKVE